ncbi:hypothetical protein EC968_009353 [Mortierella alpina]|nr:hypothetical protein EC968_009353 [Mortierella alpina]
MNTGSQGQLRPQCAAGSPQAQPTQAMRPPQQPGQQHQQHQPLMNGANLRPSSSHPNLAGGPSAQQGNRFTPPSPRLGAPESPHSRPLQQNHSGQAGAAPQQHQPTTPTQQQQQQQQGLRTSSSQPHLAQQPGARPPPGHHSPVQPNQPMSVRPPGPMMQQQQQRPQPPQGATGQALGSSHPAPHPAAPGHSVQLDIPLLDNERTNGGSDGTDVRQHPPVQSQQHQQQPRPQFPAGARPPSDQVRQQPSQTQHPTGQPHIQRQMQNPQILNPTQRPPQRPPTAPVQVPQQHQAPSSPMDGSPQRVMKEAANVPNNTVSPPPHNGGSEGADHSRLQKPAPQQQHSMATQQRPPNPQLVPGAGPHQSRAPAGPPSHFHPPRPVNAPGSPRQMPMGTVEIKVPGTVSSGSPRQPPAPQQQQQQQQQLPSQTTTTTLAEPDEPLSGSDNDAFDEDDIEGGAVNTVIPKTTAPPSEVDRPPPRTQNATAGGPPSGPPRGPPKNDNNAPRKLSTSIGSGPVRIIPPSNNPSSPPASAFPPLGQPRARVRPPPGNKVHTPYRPPERPSQTPVMYSQSGQPAFSQPFPQQGDVHSAEDPSAAASMVPHGADAASSSIRPRDGGLQKRAVASNSNGSKLDGSATKLVSPPSPKLHGQKGPAILSVSGRKSSTSTTKTLKTWMIRGGIAYLGYTAVFNCPPESSGVKGLYCKTTNGLGGLVKPLVAPHYNTYLGPHVDHYVKPVVRQTHRVYLKVADPLVQGVISAAGTVYKSTAKKHVDSAVDQAISILPYPFKPKSTAPKVDDNAHSQGQKEDHEQSPHVDKVSRQPVHVEEVKEPSLATEEGIQDSAATVPEEPIMDETIEMHSDPVASGQEEPVDVVEEHITEKPHEHTDSTAQAVTEETIAHEHHAPVLEELERGHHEAFEQPAEVSDPIGDEASESHENPAEPIVSHEEQEQEHDVNRSEDHEHTETKVLSGDMFDKIATFKDSLRNMRETEESANVEHSTPQNNDQSHSDESAPADPVAAEPVAAEPVAAEPVAAEPVAADTAPADPVPADPVPEATPELDALPTEDVPLATEQVPVSTAHEAPEAVAVASEPDTAAAVPEFLDTPTTDPVTEEVAASEAIKEDVVSVVAEEEGVHTMDSAADGSSNTEGALHEQTADGFDQAEQRLERHDEVRSEEESGDVRKQDLPQDREQQQQQHATGDEQEATPEQLAESQSRRGRYM